jgi:acetylglutamate kinase
MTNTTGVLDKDGQAADRAHRERDRRAVRRRHDPRRHAAEDRLGARRRAQRRQELAHHRRRVDHALLLEVLTNEGVGTMIRADGTPPRTAA